MTNNNMYFVANWKMYGNLSSINSIKSVKIFNQSKKLKNIKIIYCPPFTLLRPLVKKLKNSKITQFTIAPEQFGIKKTTLNSIKGGEPKDNAIAFKKLLNGQKGPYRDIVLFNSASAIVATGHESDLKTAIEMSEHSVDSGEASKKLNSLIKITN